VRATSVYRPLAADAFPEMTPEQLAAWDACLQAGQLHQRVMECDKDGHAWNPGVLYCPNCGTPMEPMAAGGYALAFDAGEILRYAHDQQYRQLCTDRARVIVTAYYASYRVAEATRVE